MLVDDVIGAASAVRASATALDNRGATTIAIGALLTIGAAAAEFAASRGVPLVSLGQLPSDTWPPESCPLCASGTELDSLP